MADIKAKDIAVAQSIASSDLILGSSINGTTANVTVETVGNCILTNLPKADLGNQSILPYVKSIHDKLKPVVIINQEFTPAEANVYSNVGAFTLNAPTLLHIRFNWKNAKPLGIAVTNSPSPTSNNILSPLIMAEYATLGSNLLSGELNATGFLEKAGTYYIFIKASTKSSSQVIVKKLIEFYT